MTKVFMLAAIIAATTTPALACHHFRVWHYRSPQRCPVALESHGRFVRAIPLAPEQTVSVEQLRKALESVEQLRKALERATAAAPLPASGAMAPGPSEAAEAQAKSSSTLQPAPAGPPSTEEGSDKPKVNDVPVNPLD